MIEFTVRGQPVPEGSMRAFLPPGARMPVVVHSNPKNLTQWRHAIENAAREAWALMPPARGPVKVTAWFYFERPASHFGTGRNAGIVKASSPTWMIVKPDLDKLVRALLDALTASAVIKDDSQVVSLRCIKDFNEWPGVNVRVEMLP